MWLIFWLSYIGFDLLAHIQILSLIPVELYHILFKLPFVLFDILTTIFLYKITINLTKNKKISLIAALLWFANPLVFWVTYIHGQYVSLVAFCITYFVYLVIKGRHILSLIPLAIAASVYYFSIILFPLIALYPFFKKDINLKEKIKKATIAVTIFLVLILIMFLPIYIGSKDGLSWLLSSVTHHAQPDSAVGVEEIKIPIYSLFNFPYFVSHGEIPSNLTAPSYFNLVSRSSVFAIILILLIYVSLFYRLLKNKITEEYSTWVIKWSGILTLVFMIFIGKFQAHYLLWVLPLIIIYLSVYKKILIIPFLIISIIPIIITLSSTNLGVFVLDSLSWNSVMFAFSISPIIQSLLGFTVILSMAFILWHILFRFRQIEEKNSAIYRELSIVSFIVILLSFSVFFVPKVYSKWLKQSPKTSLASEERIFIHSYLVYKDSITIKDNSVTLLNSHITGGNEETFAASRYIDTTDPRGKFYFYNIAADKNVYAKYNNDELVISLNSSGAKAEISFGSSGSPYLIPVKKGKVYTVTYNLSKAVDLAATSKAIVRYGDRNRKVIAPSDSMATIERSGTDFVYTIKVLVTNEEYYYLEPTLSFFYNDKLGGLQNVSIKSIKVVEESISARLVYDILPRNETEYFEDNTIRNEKASKLYRLDISIKQFPINNKISKARFNDCEPYDAWVVQAGYSILRFNTGCISSNNNRLVLNISGNPDKIKVEAILTHAEITRIPVFK